MRLKRYTEDDRERVRFKAVEALADLRRESSFYGPDDTEPGEWGIAPFAYNEADDEHDILHRVNYEIVRDELTDADDSTYEAVVRHWVGGIPIHFLVFRVDNVDLIDSLVANVDAYESYPVLDDERYYEAEETRFIDNLGEYLRWTIGMSDYVPGLAEKVRDHLGEQEIHASDWESYAYGSGDLDGEAIVRAFLIREGAIEPDPERGEEPLSSVEETLLLHTDIEAQLRARNLEART